MGHPAFAEATADKGGSRQLAETEKRKICVHLCKSVSRQGMRHGAEGRVQQGAGRKAQGVRRIEDPSYTDKREICADLRESASHLLPISRRRGRTLICAFGEAG